MVSSAFELIFCSYIYKLLLTLAVLHVQIRFRTGDFPFTGNVVVRQKEYVCYDERPFELVGFIQLKYVILPKFLEQKLTGYFYWSD